MQINQATNNCGNLINDLNINFDIDNQNRQSQMFSNQNNSQFNNNNINFATPKVESKITFPKRIIEEETEILKVLLI